MTIGPDRMSLTDLTVLAFNLNATISTGRYDTLLIEDVRKAIRNGTIFTFLKTKLSLDIDLSTLDADPLAKTELLAEWQDMEVAHEAEPRFRIEDRGLSLLFAFLLEGLQRRTRKAA